MGFVCSGTKFYYITHYIIYYNMIMCVKKKWYINNNNLINSYNLHVALHIILVRI